MENKRLKRNASEWRRESFSDRICDDLCELLLSYLSFEDQIRAEGVSKQFQRCVHQKQYKLVVSQYGIKCLDSLNGLVFLDKTFRRRPKTLSFLRDLLKIRNRINLEAFESVLKKCKAITRIEFTAELINVESTAKLILNYCHNLSQIQFPFEYLNEELLQKFGQKFGHNLKTLRLTSGSQTLSQNIRVLLRFCPNLREFRSDRPIDLRLFVANNELLIPKLNKTYVEYNELKDKQLIQPFVDYYKNSLKSIEFCNSIQSPIKTENILLAQISELKNLVHLKLFLNFGFKLNSQFARNLTLVMNECKQLKHFDICIIETDFYEQNSFTLNQFLNCFQNAKQLQTLRLCLPSDLSIQTNQSLFKAFKECKQLSDLEIEFPEVDECFFKDIDSYLSELKRLKLSINAFEPKLIVEMVSKLTKLKEIHLSYLTLNPEFANVLQFIRNCGIKDWIEKCPQIEKIVLKTDTETDFDVIRIKRNKTLLNIETVKTKMQIELNTL